MDEKRSMRSKWDLAGLTDAETGEVGGRVSDGGWYPANAEIAGRQLLWFEEGTRIVRPGAHLLEEFVELGHRDVPDEKIRDFARRWGALRICKHGLPASHNFDPYPADTGRRGCRPKAVATPVGGEVGDASDSGLYIEPLSAWRRFAGQALAALHVLSAARIAEPIPEDDWQTLYSAVMSDACPPPDRRSAVFLAGHLVEQWLALGQPRPGVLYWIEEDRIDLTAEMTGDGLFAALAVQFLPAVTRTDGIAFCSACGRLYAPDRRPAEGRRRYCPSCRKARKPKRDAEIDHRRRRRAAAESPPDHRL